MPCFVGKIKQHTTSEANLSRLFTKIRWIIESVNSRIKKWRYFANILNNLNILYIESDFKNICAIINLFRPPIAKVDDEDHIQAYNEMVILSSKENLFQKRVDSTYRARILKSKKKIRC